MKGVAAHPARVTQNVPAIVLTALIVLSPWPFGGVLPRTTMAIVVVCLLTVAIVAVWERDPLPRMSASPPVWPLAGLLGLALVQLVPIPPSIHQTLAPGSAAVWHPAQEAAGEVLGHGPHPVSVHPLATTRWVLFALAMSAMALSAAPALRRRRIALGVTIALIGSGLAVGVYGLVARLFLGDRVFGVFSVPTVAPFGPFVSKNHFAGYVEGLALLALGLAVGLADQARRDRTALVWTTGRYGSRAVWAGGAAAALTLIVGVSLSRGGVVALGAGGAAFVALRVAGRPGRPGASRELVLLCAFLVLAAGVGFLLLPGEARDRIRGLGAARHEVSGSYRLAIWRDTLRLVATSPLVGHGFGAYEGSLPRFKTTAGEIHVGHAENDWLELLAEGGGLALGLAGAMALLTLVRVVRGLRSQPDRILRGVGLGALAGALALAAHSIVDFNLRIPSNALVFTGLVALAAGAASPVGEHTQSHVRRTGACACVLLCAGLLIGVLATLSLPWSVDRAEDLSGLRLARTRPEARLRQTAFEGVLLGHLRSRPTDAPGWAWLAWTHRLRRAETARGLAIHAIWLDPLRPGFQERLRDLSRPAPVESGGSVSAP